MFKLIVFVAFLSGIDRLSEAELWEKDVSSAMKIGLSTTGYERVDLRCDAEHFAVNVTLENDFEGVVYARGTFNEKKSPCFIRHDQNLYRNRDKLTIGLRIPFDKCRTVMDVAESCFTNTIVVQHDPELIMPGDAAFSLQCSFTPEFRVSSNLSAEDSATFKSKITLVNADPAEKADLSNSKLSAFSETDAVSFPSKSKREPAKEEL